MLRINLLPPGRFDKFWAVITALTSAVLWLILLIPRLILHTPKIVYMLGVVIVMIPYFLALYIREQFLNLLHRPRGVETKVTEHEIAEFIHRYDGFLAHKLQDIRSHHDHDGAPEQSEYTQLLWALQGRARWFVTITAGIVADFCRRRAPDIEIQHHYPPARERAMLEGMLTGKLRETPVKNCGRLLRFQCPNQWSRLAVTDRPDVRFCASCQKSVYLCENEEEIVQHKGECVAFLDYDGRDYHRMIGGI